MRRKCCFKRLEALVGVPDGAKCDSGEDVWKDSNNREIEQEEEEENGDGWWQRA